MHADKPQLVGPRSPSEVVHWMNPGENCNSTHVLCTLAFHFNHQVLCRIPASTDQTLSQYTFCTYLENSNAALWCRWAFPALEAGPSSANNGT